MNSPVIMCGVEIREKAGTYVVAIKEMYFVNGPVRRIPGGTLQLPEERYRWKEVAHVSSEAEAKRVFEVYAEKIRRQA